MATMIGDFTGSDLVMKWTRDSRNANEPDIVFGDYVIDFVVNDAVLRTKYVTNVNNPQARYTFAEMVTDQNTNTPSRTISVRVRERDTRLNESASALGTFTNERPAAPSFSVTGFLAPAGATNAMIHVAISPVSDADLAGYMIFRGTSAGFTPSGGNRIYMGTSTSFFDETAVVGTTYFYKVASYDSFNSAIADLNFGSVISAVGGAALEVADIKFKDVVFTPNADGVANRLRWSTGTAYRTVEGSNTTISKVVPGSFISSGITERFVYFDFDEGLMKSNTSIVGALAKANNRILATYRGGTDLIQGVDEPIIDGQRISTGTIGAAQLITNQAIITGTAQIQNSIITDAKIANLNANKITAGFIDAARIEVGSLNGNKITANTITASLIRVGTLTGDRIAAGAIETSHMTANTIHGNRLTANTLHANRITAETITATQLVKTQNLITTSAQIGNAVITTAKIGEAQIDTLRIKNGSLGWGTEKITTTEFYFSTNVERVCTSIQIPANIDGKIIGVGSWWMEMDDDPDVTFRIVQLRKPGATWDEVNNRTFLANKGFSEIAAFFTLNKTFTVQGGDIIRITATRHNRGSEAVMHMMSQLTLFGTQR